MRKRLATLLFCGLLGFTMIGCDVDVEGETRLPEVDVDVTKGELPDVDVRGPDVDVKMKEVTVKVPDVDVDIPEENEVEIDASKERDD